MTSPFIATHGRNLPARHRNARWYGAGLVLLMLSPAACAAPSPADRESPQQIVQIAHACSATMGFSPNTLDYTDCVLSLRQSMADIQQARVVETARLACSDKASKDGTPCVPGHQQSQH